MTTSVQRGQIVQLEQIEARALADLYAAAPAAVQAALGLRMRRIGTVTVLQASRLNPWFYNRILCLGIEGPASEVHLDSAIAFYGPSAQCAVHLSPDAEPPVIREWLSARGFDQHEATVTLWRSAPNPPGIPTDLRVEAIGAEYGAAFAEIVCRVFEDPEPVGAWLAALIGRPGWRHYVAFDGNVPIATALLYMQAGLAWLAWGATLLEQRGRGAQTALFGCRIRDALVMGCTLLAVDATPDSSSYKNARRAGFEPLYLRPVFTR